MPLVEQLPEIGAEEALMRSANARIGVVTANELPQASLSGAYGDSSHGISQQFSRIRHFDKSGPPVT